MADLPANQSNSFQPSLAERQEHREWIGGRCATLLSHYWREDDPVELSAAIGQDWADVLEGLPQDAIQKACIQYQRSEPRKKPTPGAIYQLAREAMPRPQVVHSQQAPPSAKERCSPEVAQRICEEAGYTPKRFGGET